MRVQFSHLFLKVNLQNCRKSCKFVPHVCQFYRSSERQFRTLVLKLAAIIHRTTGLEFWLMEMFFKGKLDLTTHM